MTASLADLLYALNLGHNGQACFWFSNGCSIGCPECDGTTRGPGVHSHKNDFDICGLGHRATICDPRLRTVNTGAECGSENDSYYFSPWRAPGSAPVFDSCGMAGGAPTWGHHGAQYRATTHAKQGDRASLSLPSGVSGGLDGFIDRMGQMYIIRRLHLEGRSKGPRKLVHHSQSRRRISIQVVSRGTETDRRMLPDDAS